MIVRALLGFIATTAFGIGPVNAQDKEFWSDKEKVEEQSGSEGDGFWSGSATSSNAEGQGFWDSSSQDEVDRRRQVVLAQRAEQERYAAAQRERQRKLAEIERLRREERRAEREYREYLADLESEEAKRRANAEAYWRMMGKVERLQARIRSDNAGSRSASGGLSSQERAFMNRQRTRQSADRNNRIRQLERELASTPDRAPPKSKPFTTLCRVNGENLSVTPARCAQLQKQEASERKDSNGCAWKPGDAVVQEACRAD